jgi:hypothetical protein
MNRSQATKLAKRLMQFHGLVGWNVGCRKIVDFAMLKVMEDGRNGYNSDGEPYGFSGICVRKRQFILLSPYVFEQFNYEQATQTILHEIAHALASTDGHHDEWRGIAKRIGYKEADTYRDDSERQVSR